MNKNLYQVFGAGRVLFGSFTSKVLALRARDKLNSSLRRGESPYYVSPGPDHWRSKEDRTVPARGPDYAWGKTECLVSGETEYTKHKIEPDAWLEWYAATRPAAFA